MSEVTQNDLSDVVRDIIAAKAEVGPSAYLWTQFETRHTVLWPSESSQQGGEALVSLDLSESDHKQLLLSGACTVVAPAPAVYAIVDTETGGLSAEKHALVQVSIIITSALFTELDTFAHRIIPRPGYTVEPMAASINGYNAEEWLRTGMSWDQADNAYRQYLTQWFGSRKPVGVAHNAPFDVKFLQHHMPQTSELFFNPWFCTCDALRRWRARTGNKGNAKLATLNELSGYTHQGTDKAHDALGDTKACLAGLRWLKTQHEGV